MNKGRDKRVRARYRDFDPSRSPDLGAVSPKILREFQELVHVKIPALDEPFSMLALIHKMADKAVADAVGDKAVCMKGCAHCCRINVEITYFEARHIAGGTGAALVVPNENVRREGPYCPFLDQERGVCSAYRWRPFACRTFTAVDHPKYCWPPDQTHALFGHAEGGYGSEVLRRLALMLYQIAQQAGWTQEADIRDWFPEA